MNIINDEKLIRKEFEALKDELLGFLKPSSATIKEVAAEAAATAEALETQEETEAAAVADLVATDKYCNYILVTFDDGSQHILSVPKPGSSQKACVFGNVRYFKQRYAANPKKFKLSPLGLDVINS